MKPKILVGMSGGVDSSVCAYLLKERGFDPIGVTMIYWTDPDVSKDAKVSRGKCCSHEDTFTALDVCKFLGIPHKTQKSTEIFKEKVVDYFVEGYEKGITPNPCVICNKTIKFGHFLDYADELGIEYVAMGHYAQTLCSPQKDGEMFLLKGKDPRKDQSYFLHKLSSDQLRRIIFPLGHMEKSQIKEIAINAGLPIPKGKKESQDLCFYKEDTPQSFLKRHGKKSLFTKGDIKDLSGKVLGLHKGLGSYTIGQRKGIDLGGLTEPHFVVKKDLETNTLYVDKNEVLMQDTINIKDASFRQEIFDKKILGKIRVHHKGELGILTKTGEGTYSFKLENPVRAVTPGQFAVFYDGDIVLGGGEIV